MMMLFMAKFRQNCHSRQICQIRQNRRFVGTPILSSIDPLQNFVEIAIIAKFTGTPISSSIALQRNSSKSPFSLSSPDSSTSLLCRYPYLELNRSSAKCRQNRHSRQIRRIRQNCRFVGTPILSSIALR